ncbi:MAG: hypothetical protein ABSB41_04845 [Anaerolineales bacterium]|jgi:endoglucanase
MTSLNWSGFDKYKKLASVFGPPGMEGAVREELTQLLTPYVGSIETDRIGNLYAVMGPSDGTVIMISAHMDEVALIVSGITTDGYLQVKPQGYLHPEQFYMQPLVILGAKGPVRGLSTIIRDGEDTTISDIRIDIGAVSATKVGELGIQLGDRVCFSSQIEPLGPDMIIGKSADDRTGLFVLSEIARRLVNKTLPVKVILTATVQEEAIDTYAAWVGAGVAAQRINPALMLGIDTVDVRDWVPPNTVDGESQTRLNGGIGILRGAQDLHLGLVDHVLSVVQKKGLLHQIVPLPSTAADYTTVIRARAGVPCAGLAIPIRHSHSSSEIFVWKTLEDSISLMMELLDDPLELVRIAEKLS